MFCIRSGAPVTNPNRILQFVEGECVSGNSELYYKMISFLSECDHDHPCLCICSSQFSINADLSRREVVLDNSWLIDFIQSTQLIAIVLPSKCINISDRFIVVGHYTRRKNIDFLLWAYVVR